MGLPILDHALGDCNEDHGDISRRAFLNEAIYDLSQCKEGRKIIDKNEFIDSLLFA